MAKRYDKFPTEHGLYMKTSSNQNSGNINSPCASLPKFLGNNVEFS